MSSFPRKLSSSSSGDQNENEDHSSSGSVDFGLSVVVVALVFGLLAKSLPERAKMILNNRGLLYFFKVSIRWLPYTVLILLFGLILGFIHQAEPDNAMRDGIDVWTYVDPHVVLFTFLPILLFQSAFTADVHILRHEVKQIFLLAVPGVLSSTFLTACFTKLFYRDWEWNLCFLLGAILSATDPVAVVSIMKELGVDERLATLIEGESLLNDGTAIVVFTVFSKFLFHNCCSGGEVIIWAARLSIGGPAVGLAIGYAVVKLLDFRLVSSDLTSEVTLTVVACYACFMLAEGTGLHVSGVLAVVFCGIFLAYFGQGRFNVKVEKSLESFWHIAEYVADTIIFFVSGLIVARVFNEDSVVVQDWLYLLAMYVALHVIRIFNIWLFWSCMTEGSSYGENWDHKQASILVMGGLRGAVGLALALVTDHELQDSDLPHAQRKAGRVLFHVAGIAFLTLLVNGTLMHPLIELLGLAESSKAELELFHHSVSVVETRLEEQVEELKTDIFLGHADFQQIWRYLPVISKEQYLSRIESGKIKLCEEEKKDIDIAFSDHSAVLENSTGYYKHCPAPLQGVWRLYHTEFSSGRTIVARSTSSLSTSSVSSKSLDGLSRLSKLEEKKKQALAAVEKANHDIRKLKKDIVNESTRVSLREARALAQAANDVENYTSSLSSIAEDVEIEKIPESSERLMSGRTRYLTALKARYISNHHLGRMQAQTLRYLLNCANNQLDHPDKEMSDWDELERRLKRGFRVPNRNSGSFNDRLVDVPFLGSWVSYYRTWSFYKFLCFVQEIANEFIYASQSVDLDEVLDDNAQKEKIKKEVETQKDHALEFIRSFMQWPEISIAVNTIAAARQLLMFHGKLVDELVEHGALTESEVDILSEKTSQAMERLGQHPMREKTRDIETVLLEGPGEYGEACSFISGVHAREIKQLLKRESHADESRGSDAFENIFVEPNSMIFVKGHTKAFPYTKGAEIEDGQVLNEAKGRKGWFIKVRGQMRCFDENGKEPTVAPPMDCIGLVEQVCEKPMRLTYQTTSWAQLIFVDSNLYVKEAWERNQNNGGSGLFDALYRRIASLQLPIIFRDERVSFGIKAFSESKFVPVRKAAVATAALSSPRLHRASSASEAESNLRPTRQRSRTSETITRASTTKLLIPDERNRSMSNTLRGHRLSNTPLKYKALELAAITECSEGSVLDTVTYIELEIDKIYMLICGEIIERMPETREEGETARMVEGVRKLAKSKSSLLESFGDPQKYSSSSERQHLDTLSHIDGLLDRLLDNGDAARKPVKRKVAPAFLKNIQGKVIVSNECVIMEVPSYLLAAKAATRFLRALRGHKDKESQKTSIFDVIQLKMSNKKFFHGEEIQPQVFKVNVDAESATESHYFPGVGNYLIPAE